MTRIIYAASYRAVGGSVPSVTSYFNSFSSPCGLRALSGIVTCQSLHSHALDPQFRGAGARAGPNGQGFSPDRARWPSPRLARRL